MPVVLFFFPVEVDQHFRQVKNLILIEAQNIIN